MIGEPCPCPTAYGTQMQTSKAKLLIEPVVSYPALDIVGLPTAAAVSLHKVEFVLKVTHLDGPPIVELELSNIQLRFPDGAVHTFSAVFSLGTLRRGDEVKTPPLSTVFPVSGLHMVSAVVSCKEPSLVECYQKTLSGSTGRGWKRDGDTCHWHGPLVVADRMAYEQRSLNMSVNKLTSQLLILTYVLVLLGVVEFFKPFASWRTLLSFAPSALGLLGALLL